MDLRELQYRIKHVDDTDKTIDTYFYKLTEEIGELSRAIRKRQRMKDIGGIKGSVEEEFYDVLYYLVGLANIFEVDLETCAILKEELNAKKYHRDSIYKGTVDYDQISQ